MKIKKLLVFALSITLILSLTACNLFDKNSSSESSEDAIEKVVDSGYPVKIGETDILKKTETVVSLADSITEKLFDLGFLDRLVGVSSYASYPEEALGIANCGTSLIPDLNAIEESGATLVFTASPLPALDTQALEELGIVVAVLEQPSNLVDLYNNYTSIASVMEGNENGISIATDNNDKIKNWLVDTKSAIDTAKDNDVPVLYIKELDFTVATGDSLEQELFSALGLKNIAQNQTGWDYPEELANSKEGLADFKSLELILIDKADITIEKLQENEFYKSLPAVTNKDYLYIDSAAMERSGFSMFAQAHLIASYVWSDAELPIL